MTLRRDFATAFDPVARTVDASGIPGFDARRLIAIIDKSGPHRGLLYDETTPGLGLFTVSGAVMTLDCDTSALNAADLIQIYWDDGLVVPNPAVLLSALLTLSEAQLAPLVSALLSALPNSANIPEPGQPFINSSGFVVIAQ